MVFRQFRTTVSAAFRSQICPYARRESTYLDRSGNVCAGRAETTGGGRRPGRRTSVHGPVEFALAPVRNEILIVAALLGVVPEVRVVRVRRTVFLE